MFSENYICFFGLGFFRLVGDFCWCLKLRRFLLPFLLVGYNIDETVDESLKTAFDSSLLRFARKKRLIYIIFLDKAATIFLPPIYEYLWARGLEARSKQSPSAIFLLFCSRNLLCFPFSVFSFSSSFFHFFFIFSPVFATFNYKICSFNVPVPNSQPFLSYNFITHNKLDGKAYHALQQCTHSRRQQAAI